ncbi:hypothetical protein A2609_01165 [Candidatus Kaiserbacteria bacterium RIFOXYD1_FULL_47_14]|uniref:Glycosyl transferase family 1 domain-containing protein n=1 Tax=Candidatus Kaiserbacteria bacterium RIFOXYD1_FULL_47_14 TaxID=1798533 RepID=A0A1F6G6U9_9BACT|nr:MAG: hypothetical protein A2609_01165 [Candidatus Kaiserbacteria bacterium RIFOXYD1_FULL_47_14]
MDNRHIILVTDYGAPYIGGMEVHAEECARHFEKYSNFAGVCLMPLSDSNDALSHFRESTALKAKITPLSRSSIFTSEELEHALIQHGISNMTVLFFNSLYWVRILGDLKRRFPHIKIFLRSGGNDIFQARIEGVGETLTERQSYIVKQITSYADGLIVNSQFSKNRISGLGIPENLMSIVSGGIDISRFTPANREEKNALRERLGLPKDCVIILAACRLVRFKGIKQTLTVLGRIRTQKPFLYIVIGDGPEHATLEQHVHEIGIQEQVRFIKTVPHTIIPDYFRAADIYCYFPRLETMNESGGSYVHTETMGRSFCEAMAAGLPIVASQVGSVAEIVHSGVHGFLIDTENLQEESATLAQMIDNPLQCEEMGIQARQYAEEQYSWETVCSRYQQLFSSL